MEELQNLEPEHDWWDDLSEDQKQNILKGIADIEAGRVMLSEEFWRRLKGGKSTL